MLKDFFAKRKAKRTFEKVVNKETVDALLDNRPLDGPQIKSGRYEFAFVFVRQETLEQLSKCIEDVVDACIEHGAVVQTIFGQIVTLTFGTHSSIKHLPGARSKLVGALSEQFSNDIKIVHGAVDGHFGLFGGANSVAYTFTFPGFDEALARLCALRFGESVEFGPPLA